MQISKKKMIRILFLYIIVFLSILLTIKTEFTDPSLLSSGKFGIKAFYKLFNMDTLLYTFLTIIILSPNFISIDFFHQKRGFSDFILTRIDTRQYMKKTILQSFLTGFMIMLLIEVTAHITLHFFYDPLTNKCKSDRISASVLIH